MPPEGFEPTIPAGERLQAHDLDSAVTGIGTFTCTGSFIYPIMRLELMSLEAYNARNILWIVVSTADRLGFSEMQRGNCSKLFNRNWITGLLICQGNGTTHML
jgi:hypothetical protein